MMTTDIVRAWWAYLRSAALAQPGSQLQAQKTAVPHPRDAGAYLSVGVPVGQDADYRFAREHDCRGVHVQSFGQAWVLHVDTAHPECSVLEHVRRDAPGTWVASATAVGGLLGLLLGRGKEAALAGAAVGAIVGALQLDVAARSPLRGNTRLEVSTTLRAVRRAHMRGDSPNPGRPGRARSTRRGQVSQHDRSAVPEG